MDSVNKTLYIPLYGKALVSRKGIILRDKKAEEIWNASGFSLKGKSASKWLAYYLSMRAAVFDDWVSAQLKRHPDAVVLHLGCGLDSRCVRAGAEAIAWYDVDFPAVIEERKRYFSESECYRMISRDVRDGDLLNEVQKAEYGIVVMEGITMYLPSDDLNALLGRIAAHFENAEILMDCYSSFAARASRFKNPVNDVGVRQVWGVDDPGALAEGTGFTFAAEKGMSPEELISQLSKSEQKMYRMLYAGGVSGKLYRLYEFKKGKDKVL